MQKKTKDRYYVAVHVMPYVERYMTDNYGVRDERVKNLVNISRDPVLASAFLPRLRKKPLSNSPRGGDMKMKSEKIKVKNDGKEKSSIAKRRTGIINIEISKETFERVGWMLSPEDESTVARLLELRCQGLLLVFLQADYILTGDLAQSIRHFYRTFRQTEDTWPTDSIRKIWNRNVPERQRKTLQGMLQREILKIITGELYRNGTLSKQGLLRYSQEP